jgi:flagellar hook protein FlgE
MGFGQGLSGLNAASQNLDVIGNDIANSQTVGYKGSSIAFADVYASSQVGLGVGVANVIQDYSSGDISTTGGQYDVAINGTGQGFFVLQDSAGNKFYTRNGQLNVDANFNLVNASNGMQVMGYPPNSTFTAAAVGANLQAITIPQGSMLPAATSSVTVQTNLNANATPFGANGVGSVVMTLGGTSSTYYYKTVSGTTTLYTDSGATTPAGAGTYTDSAGTSYTVAAGGTLTSPTSIPDSVASALPSTFSPTDSTTYTNSVPTTVYDSLGNSHQMVEYFVKSASSGSSSVYNVYYYLDGNAMSVGGTAGAPQQLTFNSSGTLTTTPSSVTVTYTFPTGTSSPANPLSISMNYGSGNVTQYGSDFSPKITANGNPSGDYTGVTIATNGNLVASYSNGLTQIVGAIALARFNNPAGLQPESGNVWAETQESGQPTTGAPGSAGLASLKGQAVEESNVNLSNSLVNLIIAQRTYQANAQTIKTQDSVLQTLLNMS